VSSTIPAIYGEVSETVVYGAEGHSGSIPEWRESANSKCRDWLDLRWQISILIMFSNGVNKCFILCNIPMTRLDHA